MFFTKYPYRANFSFCQSYEPTSGKVMIGKHELRADVRYFDQDIAHIQISGSLWDPNLCLEPLSPPPATNAGRLKVDSHLDWELIGKFGEPLLRGRKGESFGICDVAHLFQIEVPEGSAFFGMGEKTFGKVELSGYRTKFWNVDVWGDFHFGQWVSHSSDPTYFTTPYVAMRVGDEWVGFLLHNPFSTFIETPGIDEAPVFVEWQRTSPYLTIGSEGGEPNLWVLYAESLKELTRKLQCLIGVTPLPPAWAMGYHQSRWGYAGHDDLVALDRKFAQLQIPCESLWMDLEYMTGFRVFQTSPDAFPGGAKATAEALKTNDRKIVPILDPGVKVDPEYRVYKDGIVQDVFCKGPEGHPFVGMVWPGDTVFPDFSLLAVRDWWAGYVREFAEEGFHATWIDMNDPSTGPVDPQAMLFRNGTQPHAAFRNQYALGMQIATLQGLLAARPEERPFVLSRSGFTGTSKYAAVWTGDNISNDFYLANSIPAAIGMSLSGLPFSGPDIGGFGGDCTPELMLAWTKACFLFPFFRNHSAKSCKRQEPFAFPAAFSRLIARYIRLRYKLFPYLYNLFVDQEELGEAILRPLFYEFEDARLEKLNDSFLIGPSVLQAPFVQAVASKRKVTLPGSDPWFDLSVGEWRDPGEHVVRFRRSETPVYVRQGSVLPMQPGTPVDNTKELRKVHFHLFVPASGEGESQYQYRADDGLSFEYRNGKRSELAMQVRFANGVIEVEHRLTHDGYGPIEFGWVVHGGSGRLISNGEEVELAPAESLLTGKSLRVLASEA